MRPMRRRRSRARPRPAQRATTSWASRWEAEVEEHRDALLASATPVESIDAMEVTEVDSATDVRVIGQPAWRRNKAVYVRPRGS